MADITVSELFVDGVQLPTPALDGVTITSEKVWSNNTGRDSSGLMVGTIVAIKAKISIKWPPLTMGQVAVIEAAASDSTKPFVSMKYTDMTGETVTKTVYFGTPTYSQYSWSPSLQYVKDVSVNAIER